MKSQDTDKSSLGLMSLAGKLPSLSILVNAGFWESLGLSALPAFHRRALLVIFPLLLLLILLPWSTSTESVVTPQAPTTPERVSVPLTTTPLDKQSTVTPTKVADELREKVWVTYQVRSGDTLTQVFRANNLQMEDLNELIRVEGSDKPLSNLSPGQLIRYKLTKGGDIDILQVERSDGSVMFFRLSQGGFGRSN